MSEFMTWQAMTTQAGSLFATMTLTQLLKQIGIFRRIPPQLLCFLVALLLLLLATAFTYGLSISRALIAPVNAAITTLACNGTYDALHKKSEAQTSTEESVS